MDLKGIIIYIYFVGEFFFFLVCVVVGEGGKFGFRFVLEGIFGILEVKEEAVKVYFKD